LFCRFCRDDKKIASSSSATRSQPPTPCCDKTKNRFKVQTSPHAAVHCKPAALNIAWRRNDNAAGRSQSALPLNEDLTRCTYLLHIIKQFDSFTSKCSKPSDPMPWYDFMDIFFRSFSY
jgi:hypothetical protein